jgi:hypothetical protein
MLSTVMVSILSRLRTLACLTTFLASVVVETTGPKNDAAWRAS